MLHPFNLPFELGDLIFTSLPPSALAQLCLVSRYSYARCLPHLYHHVHIKIRRHWRQLDLALKRSPLLRQVLRTYTKQLTVTCCQSSYQWLITQAQADWCQRWLANLHTLTFCDFAILHVEQVAWFLAHPTINSLRFRYCNLVCHDQVEAYIPLAPEDHPSISIYQLPAPYYYHNTRAPFVVPASLSPVSCLDLESTDFSSVAIQHLLQLVPRITSASFGANHNRIKDANSSALDALRTACPTIHTLKTALQQIHPSSLHSLIAFYGVQLLSLDLSCHDATTLTTVAQHATHVKHLVLHPASTIRKARPQSTHWTPPI
ncbi:hypothetical protein [Absidia glauca]|uniref:F-box domain-containing protein n=1 Tax=Absidia glauca TaxID=4829 RepID=A0A163MD92_ABSGL|nr:hypothetical protein [Absidia glauca]